MAFMSVSNGDTDKNWFTVALKWGPVAVIAVGALLWITQSADRKLDAQGQTLIALQAAQATHQVELVTHASMSTRQAEVQIRILREICYSLAKTREAFQKCGE